MYFKVIQSGHIFEVYHYPIPPAGVDDISGKRIADWETKPPQDINPDWEYYSDEEVGEEKDDQQLSERPYKRRKTNINSARNQIRRIVSSNFASGDIFVTTTFRENVTDREYAIQEWSKFLKRLKRRCGTLKYLTVVEYQKRGAIHFHTVMSMEKPFTALGKLWKHGWVQWDFIKNKKDEDKPIDNIGAYMIKYLMKDIKNAEQSTKSYFASRNLIRPLEYRGMDALEKIMEYNLTDIIPAYTDSYDMTVLKDEQLITVPVTYHEFNLKRKVEFGYNVLAGELDSPSPVVELHSELTRYLRDNQRDHATIVQALKMASDIIS